MFYKILLFYNSQLLLETSYVENIIGSSHYQFFFNISNQTIIHLIIHITNHKLFISTSQHITINYLFYQFLIVFFSSYIENSTTITTKQHN